MGVGTDKAPLHEEAIYLAQNTNWAQDSKMDDYKPNIDLSLGKILIIFVLYLALLFFLFPKLFTGTVQSFVFNMFIFIVIFIICFRLYAFISNEIHENKPRQRLQTNTDEYASSDIIKAQKETAMNEWKKICIHCGAKIFADKEFCPSCGEKLTFNAVSLHEIKQKSNNNVGEHSDYNTVRSFNNSTGTAWIICIQCGAKIFADELFCSSCGTESSFSSVSYDKVKD